MTSILTKLLFGPRANGEKLPEPRKFPVRKVTEVEYNRWASEFKVGSRYGHRGSFYENNFRATVA